MPQKKMPEALNSLIDSSKEEESFKVNDSVREFFAVGAQMQLVAEPMTASLVNDLVLKYNDLLIKSTLNKNSYRKALVESNGLEKERDRALSESERISGELKSISDVPLADSDLLNSLLRARERCVAEEKDAKLKYLEAQQKAVIERFRLLKLCLPDVKEILDLQVKVLIGIRQDLGLKSDVELLEMQAKKQLAVMESIVRYLDDLVKAHEKK